MHRDHCYFEIEPIQLQTWRMLMVGAGVVQMSKPDACGKFVWR